MENIIKLFSDKVALGILHMRIWFNRLENRMRENEYLCADDSENGSSCKAHYNCLILGSGRRLFLRRRSSPHPKQTSPQRHSSQQPDAESYLRLLRRSSQHAAAPLLGLRHFFVEMDIAPAYGYFDSTYFTIRCCLSTNLRACLSPPIKQTSMNFI